MYFHPNKRLLPFLTLHCFGLFGWYGGITEEKGYPLNYL
jgi:hypothetical protein